MWASRARVRESRCRSVHRLTLSPPPLERLQSRATDVDVSICFRSHGACAGEDRDILETSFEVDRTRAGGNVLESLTWISARASLGPHRPMLWRPAEPSRGRAVRRRVVCESSATIACSSGSDSRETFLTGAGTPDPGSTRTHGAMPARSHLGSALNAGVIPSQ